MTDDDRTTRARVRDSAIVAFARSGVAATGVRSIADAAGVSPALVIHHFGSKNGLVAECDTHVASLIDESKQAMLADGSDVDPVGRIQMMIGDVPVLAYLARRLTDGQPDASPLLDHIVDDAVAHARRAVDRGLMKPTDDLRARTIVLTLWSLGAVALHPHVDRLLGADLTGDPADMAGYTVPAAEILSSGVMTEHGIERINNP